MSNPPSHNQHTQDELKGLQKSIRYEARMFVYAAKRQEELYPARKTEQGWRDYNLAVEGFLLHFRILKQFLAPGGNTRRYPTDVFAWEYVSPPRPSRSSRSPREKRFGPWRADSKRAKALIDAINQRLAHMTDAREGRHYSFRFDKLRTAMGMAYGAWLDALEKENRGSSAPFTDKQIGEWVEESRLRAHARRRFPGVILGDRSSATTVTDFIKIVPSGT